MFLFLNGRGGIWTHGGLAPSLVFKTSAINHSTTLPYFTSKSSLRTLRLRLCSWYKRSCWERTFCFFSFPEFIMTTFDKSTAETLSSLTVIMLGQPQTCVLLLLRNSVLHSLHLTIIIFHGPPGSNARWRDRTADRLGVNEMLYRWANLAGSSTWTRTRDRVINSHLLYQLSYRGICVPRRESGWRGSNPWQELGRLACYRYTTPAGRVLYGRGGGGGLFQCPATQVGFEPTTDCLEGSCSIQLSYWVMWWFLSPLILNHQGDYRSWLCPLYSVVHVINKVIILLSCDLVKWDDFKFFIIQLYPLCKLLI